MEIVDTSFQVLFVTDCVFIVASLPYTSVSLSLSAKRNGRFREPFC